MLHVALLEPEIPPNTGNIARACAATNSRLHLIGQLGYSLDDKYLKRAGLDYWPHVDLHVHASWEAFLQAVPGVRIVPLSTKATQTYTRFAFADGDCLLFGRESVGLPADILERYADTACTIPMPGAHVRSLNLSTAVGIVLYEALRQLHGW